MTQILSAVSSRGIMVATDSMAVAFNAEGRERRFRVEKLFPVGSHAFIVSGGMGVSVGLSAAFKQYAEERNLLGIEAIIAAAGGYLSSRHGEFLAGRDPGAPSREQLDRLYFLVGGYSFKSRSEPYQMALWASETGKPPLERLRLGAGVAIPRSLSGEMQLHRMCQEKRSLEELAQFALRFLQKLASANPGIGPPFRFAAVTSAGFTRLHPESGGSK